MRRRRNKCLILEGGGVKCAYQYGVMRTLGDLLDDIDGVAGSSFGALNAALYLSGGVERMADFWNELSAERIFKEPQLQRIMEKMYRKESIFDIRSLLFFLGNSAGDPLAKHRNISELYIDYIVKNVEEDSIRRSGKEFGLTAVELSGTGAERDAMAVNLLTTLGRSGKSDRIPQQLTDSMQHLREFFMKDIKKGRLPYFVAASACLPTFRPIGIDGKFYIDGGVLDNIPIKMMEDKGYKHFLCIRTNMGEPKVRWSEKAKITFITPSRDLGSCALFSKDNILELIALGEYDAAKFMEQQMLTN